LHQPTFRQGTFIVPTPLALSDSRKVATHVRRILTLCLTTYRNQAIKKPPVRRTHGIGSTGFALRPASERTTARSGRTEVRRRRRSVHDRHWAQPKARSAE